MLRVKEAVHAQEGHGGAPRAKDLPEGAPLATLQPSLPSGTGQNSSFIAQTRFLSLISKQAVECNV